MKLKVYINTYDNNEILNDSCLKSIFDTEFDRTNTSITVVDNHSNVYIQEQYNKEVKVIHNELRPDFSTGHLARNWNLCLINGFRDLEHPDCDAVILVQVDSWFSKDWFSNILKIKNASEYSLKYITYGAGDQFQYFTVDAIKNIGLYDERFCNIGFQEADYFLRAVKFYSEHVSINDHVHGRKHNVTKLNFLDTAALKTGIVREDLHNLSSLKHHKYSRCMFHHKWDIQPEHWPNSDAVKHAQLKTTNHILYPYFESKIPKETLLKQNYIIP